MPRDTSRIRGADCGESRILDIGQRADDTHDVTIRIETTGGSVICISIRPGTDVIVTGGADARQLDIEFFIRRIEPVDPAPSGQRLLN